MIDPLKELNSAIDDYSLSRTTLDPAELIDIRDRISLSRFYLSNEYAEVRHDAEAAEFRRKIFMATKAENLRLTFTTAKKLTRDQLSDRVLIASEGEYVSEAEAKKEYYKFKMVVESSAQILHSIASRINNLDK